MQPDLVTEIEFNNFTKPFRKGAPSALRTRATRAAVAAYKLEIATANVSVLSPRFQSEVRHPALIPVRA